MLDNGDLDKDEIAGSSIASQEFCPSFLGYKIIDIGKMSKDHFDFCQNLF